MRSDDKGIVEVYVWLRLNPHISLKIKQNNKVTYLSYSPSHDAKFVDALSTDQQNLGSDSSSLTFDKLCISDILARYKRFQRNYRKNSNSLDGLSTVDFVDELLVAGGLKELPKFYVSTPTLVKAFALLIAGGLLMLADNDIAKIIGMIVLAAGASLWAVGSYQRSSRNCFRKKTWSVQDYYNQRVLPAHQLNIKRPMPLLKDRDRLCGSLVLCSVALISGGVILLVLPEEFTLDKAIVMGTGAGALATGYLLACACYQFYKKPTPESRQEEKPRSFQAGIPMAMWVSTPTRSVRSLSLNGPLLEIDSPSII